MHSLAIVAGFLTIVAGVQAATLPTYPLKPRAQPLPGPQTANSSCLNLTPHDNQSQGGCQHGPSSRQCWGDYSADTNWYDDTPYTGVTREYWLVAQNITMAPDGYEQQVMVFNGSLPGPTIFADWGDDVIVHVTNAMADNGTSIHWHGIRQLNNNEYDGVPGVTQCPISPGQSYTYKWRASQYGSSWYHSHFSFQYSSGLFGPIIVNGPATSDYDEDLGALSLMDWAHISSFNEWWWDRPKTGPPAQANSLINGTNVFDCSQDNTTQCVGKGEVGQRYELTFESGKKYRLRLVNTGLYSHFRFAIDGHNLTVIGMDFVPIVPYTTDSLLISMGQRYDIIIEANAPPSNYWMRPIWQRSCCDNDAWNNTLGIVRYAEANSTALPTTTNPATEYPYQCEDEPMNHLVPYMPLNVPAPDSISLLNLNYSFVPMPAGFLFTLNSSYIWVNFSAPTNFLLSQGETQFDNEGFNPKTFNQTGFTNYDAIPLSVADQWVYFGIQDISHRNRSHPMHLHGHDYYVIGQGFGPLDGSVELTLTNPPRRDVATVPLNGYMVLAFKTDNPGAWLLHCHIAAHSSEGLGLQFVERENEIMGTFEDVYGMQETCYNWQNYWNNDEVYMQEDAGI